MSTLQVPWHPSAQNASSPISNSNDQETNNKSIVSAAALFGGIIASRYGENEICWWNKGGREHAIREQGGTTLVICKQINKHKSEKFVHISRSVILQF